MLQGILVMLVATTGTSTTPAGTKQGSETSQRAALFAALVDCKSLTDPSQRLACYDKSVDALDRAEKQSQVVIMDRAQVNATRRSLFGFSLPKIRLFGSGTDTEDLDRLETTITGFTRDADDRLIFSTAEGASWRQIDDRPSFPRAGTKLILQRATLGAYYARIGPSSIKVIRTR